ncbi:MAG TPA: VWA domain-containing protein [Kofleriaceae bacterium]
MISAVLVFAVGCGPKDRNNDGGGGGGGGLTVDAPACATSVTKADQVPLDLYVMLDQSSSMDDSVMGGTKWTAVTSAIQTFLGQPGLTGVSVGLQFFAVPAGTANTCTVFTCTTDTDCGGSACGPCTFGVCLGAFSGLGGDSCAAADYATPAVEIAPLPGVATSIDAAMGMHSPTTSTPTSAALQGAVDHAQAWQAAHASDAVAVILATDGDPTECDTNLADIDAIAATAAAAMPKLLTFVIGVGTDTSNLDGIAMGGGTGSAFLVDTGGNVNQEFLDAMNAIRHAALGCAYQIPMGTGPVDYNEVNVVYQPGNGGQPVTLPYVMDAANCPANGNGWYYDNPAAPTEILLCSSTCTTIEGDMTGEVDITLGCATIVQ